MASSKILFWRSRVFYHKNRSEFYSFLIHCLTYTYKYKKTLGHLISRPRYFRQAKKKTQKTKQKQYTVSEFVENTSNTVPR